MSSRVCECVCVYLSLYKSASKDAVRESVRGKKAHNNHGKTRKKRSNPGLDKRQVPRTPNSSASGRRAGAAHAPLLPGLVIHRGGGETLVG